ncbi:MATE family efflux transporter [Deferribacterales bacterium]|nr:MATE family efflux transporter [Deferribacterales bacterium]
MNAKYKQFIKQSWHATAPMLVILFFDFAMSMTDVLVARLLGKETQAAVGLANQSYYMVAFVIYALTVGTIATISRVHGSDEREKKLPRAILTAITIASGCALVITLLSVLISPFIIEHFGVADEVRRKAVNLVHIYCCGIFFQLMVQHFNGILRACQLVHTSMAAMIAAGIINITLNIVFVFYTPIGEAGIALSTAVAWLFAFFITGWQMLKLMKWRFIKLSRDFSREIASKIARISWPSAIVSCNWQISGILIFAIVGMLPENSTETMAALTAGLRIEAVIFMPAFAFNMANAVLVGHLLGENKPDDAFTMGLLTTIVGVFCITVITLAVIMGATPLANLLAAKGTNGEVDGLVLQEITKYLRIVMISEPFVAAHLMFGGALMGAGDTRALMYYHLISLWVFRIPIAYIFGIVLGYGAVGIWWAMNFTFFCQAILAGRRYLSRRWLSNY